MKGPVRAASAGVARAVRAVRGRRNRGRGGRPPPPNPPPRPNPPQPQQGNHPNSVLLFSTDATNDELYGYFNIQGDPYKLTAYKKGLQNNGPGNWWAGKIRLTY